MLLQLNVNLFKKVSSKELNYFVIIPLNPSVIYSL
jgi:hypothetical protein